MRPSNKNKPRAKKANKRTPRQIEDDRNFCFAMSVKGYSIRDVTGKLNDRNVDRDYTLSHQQVNLDIRWVVDQARELRKDTLENHIEKELTKLDRIENEAWVAWERSKEAKRKVIIEGGDLVNQTATGGKISKRESTTTNGNVRFLEMIDRCMERRSRLLGLNVAEKTETKFTLDFEDGDL